ncbi:winged helix-turn-helix domain-containing protein [soil metagenome]
MSNQKIEAGHSSRPLRFGPNDRFELRPAEFTLLVDGKPVSLGSRATQLLIALAGRPCEVLTKSELLDTVWPGLVVEEGNVHVQINALRRVLGNGVIATIPGRGYRLNAANEATLPAPVPLRAQPRQQLYGRADDLDRLDRFLGSHACVTLVGPSGVGKSSLARAVEAQRPGATAWIDLVALSEGSQIPNAIARAIGRQLEEGDPESQLLRILVDATWLLILDNAEHLIEPVAHWTSVLSQVSGVRLLVTSQLPLAIKDERVMRIEPLPVLDSPDWAGSRDDALALLLDRIAAVDSRYVVAPSTLPLLAELCRQLDGLPLAIEMAAARVPLMGPKGVLGALKERFSLLSRGRRDAPARHRTLHGAIDWSYDLLDAEQQRLFRILGLFAGGFTIELAVAVASTAEQDRWEIVDGLATLVDRSLVAVSHDEPPRYRLLETLRAYALEQLVDSLDADALQALHRRHAQAMQALFVHPQDHGIWRAEMDNVRAAFLWARERDLDGAAQLSSCVTRMIAFTTWRQEVCEWMAGLEATMRSPEGQALPLRSRANWWSMRAYVLNLQQSRAGTAASRLAVELWRELDDPDELQFAAAGLVRSILAPGEDLDDACRQLIEVSDRLPATPTSTLRVQGALAIAAHSRSDFAALLACRELELQAAEQLGMTDRVYAASSNVCAALIGLKRYEQAVPRARALLQRIDESGDDGNANLPWILHMLIWALARLGDFEAALALVPRSLEIDRRFGVTVAWNAIMTLCEAQDRIEAAAQLVGYAMRLWTFDGAELSRDDAVMAETIRSIAVERFGASVAQSLETQGSTMSQEQAVALIGIPST